MKIDARKSNFADLFCPTPEQWGYRGDPHLWEDLKGYFNGKPLPKTTEALADSLIEAFRALVGVDLALLESKYLEKYAHGGMSSGLISGRFWRETGFPLILDRFRIEYNEQFDSVEPATVKFSRIS